jgi:hypothetical protein
MASWKRPSTAKGKPGSHPGCGRASSNQTGVRGSRNGWRAATQRAAAETPTALYPTAAALAADGAKSDPELARKAFAYFDKQSHLIEIQTDRLHEQRAVNLQLLKLWAARNCARDYTQIH